MSCLNFVQINYLAEDWKAFHEVRTSGFLSIFIPASANAGVLSKTASSLVLLRVSLYPKPCVASS